MSQHVNDGTLAPEMDQWLRRYTGTERWIIEIAERTSDGIAPLPDELRRLERVKIASAEGGWLTVS